MANNSEDWDYVLIFIPIILSWIVTYLTGRVGKVGEYKKAWFQPPGWVFFVVWTLLYFMLGYLLFKSKRDEDYTTLGMIIGLLFLTYLWQYLFVYLKNYKLAIIDLLAILVLGFILFGRLIQSSNDTNITFGEGSIYIFAPFLGWIIFAMLLSSNTKRSSPSQK